MNQPVFDCPCCACRAPAEPRSRFESAERREAMARRPPARAAKPGAFADSRSTAPLLTDFELGQSAASTPDGAHAATPARAVGARDLDLAETPRRGPAGSCSHVRTHQNEAAFLYQLVGRLFGTNNFPDCSNMCHDSSGVALSEVIGINKGTVSLSDFDHADLIFVVGQNPGTNHPRMLSTLREAARRGAAIVAINPLREVGLVRFAHPQKPLDVFGGAAREALRPDPDRRRHAFFLASPAGVEPISPPPLARRPPRCPPSRKDCPPHRPSSANNEGSVRGASTCSRWPLPVQSSAPSRRGHDAQDRPGCTRGERVMRAGRRASRRHSPSRAIRDRHLMLLRATSAGGPGCVRFADTQRPGRSHDGIYHCRARVPRALARCAVSPPRAPVPHRRTSARSTRDLGTLSRSAALPDATARHRRTAAGSSAADDRELREAQPQHLTRAARADPACSAREIEVQAGGPQS